MLISGCEVLRPAVAPHPAFYLLSGKPGSESARPVSTSRYAAAPTLMVSPPHAAAGFDSQRIMYMRRTNQLEYFAHNEWIDTPARMMAPLIVAAVEGSGAFHAVMPTPGTAMGEIRLDTEIVRLQQEFLSTPSQVRFTLRAYLVDTATRRVIETREFDTTVVAASDDPYGGVVAANLAVQRVLENLAGFCAEVVRSASPINKAEQ